MRDALAAFAAMACVLALHAAQGFPTLTDFGGDNDSLLRLVEVRDLLAGQGWFDLHQYRMGPEGGFVMHWSRLVDAPIAALMLLGGENFALVAWPALLFAAALWLVLRIARALGGAPAFLPALVIGGAALHFLGIFAPGALDHHNTQLVLTLAVLAALLAATGPLPAVAAGAAAAAMLAVAMEAAPYVVAAGLAVAGLFAFDGERGRTTAFRFGLAFAGVAALAMALTVPPPAWSAVACDAFSLPQAGLGVAAGLGLALVAGLPAAHATTGRRIVSLAVLGVVLAAALAGFFPECLADPYAGLDERLKTYWLDQITEAQSLSDILRSAPLMALGYYMTPLLAVGVLVVGWTRRGFSRQTAVAGAFLIAAVLVSIWQVRGAVFAIPLAVPVLGAWVGRWRIAAASGAPRASLGMVAAWLLSVNAAWTGLANALAGPPPPSAGGGRALTACQSASDYAALAGMPATRVLAISNLGAPILRYTGHSVFSGPYHRNVEGNLAALDMLMGEPEAARQAMQAAGVTLVAACPGNDESKALAGWAPNGLAARLNAGDPPPWLLPTVGPEGPLRIYRLH